jgi:hypothetical protein
MNAGERRFKDAANPVFDSLARIEKAFLVFFIDPGFARGHVI